MKKVIKRDIDNLAVLEIEMRKARKEFQAVEKKYKLALGPILQYLDDVLKIPPTKGAQMRGKTYIVDFGTKREQRFILDMVEALRRLESVREGLGYEHISIPLGVLDEELRKDETTDLIGKSYGNRSVKSTFIGEEDA
jgi:hypothetical protein